VLFLVGRDSLSADNVDIENYEMQTRNALMGEFINSYEYELKESSDKDDKSVQLIWKKVVEKDRIKVYVLPCLFSFAFSRYMVNCLRCYHCFLCHCIIY